MPNFKITHLDQEGRIITNMYTSPDLFQALNAWSETIPDSSMVNQLHVTQ